MSAPCEKVTLSSESTPSAVESQDRAAATRAPTAQLRAAAPQPARRPPAIAKRTGVRTDGQAERGCGDGGGDGDGDRQRSLWLGVDTLDLACATGPGGFRSCKALLQNNLQGRQLRLTRPQARRGVEMFKKLSARETLQLGSAPREKHLEKLRSAGTLRWLGVDTLDLARATGPRGSFRTCKAP